MASVSSDDDGSDRQSYRCGSYSLSADVSESESCSSFSCRRFGGGGALTSLTSSPRPVAEDFCFPAQVMLPVVGGKDVVAWEEKHERRDGDLTEMEMMKERFCKLLLGEDMSGGGKGVCSALAISNAITNLSATVFGELWKLEPIAPRKKAMWHREMEYLLSMSDYIVELVPSIQQFPGGGTYEIMATQPRSDLFLNLPALKKLDALLLSMLDGFCNTEFVYLDSGIGRGGSNEDKTSMLGGRISMRQEEKWWLPYPKIPSDGLSENTRNGLQQCKDCANQIWKAAMAINSNVLAEMEIPKVYLENLPKRGRACLGDIMYRHIKAAKFSPECLLDCLDLSSEHHALDLANMIEESIHVWKQKDEKKVDNKIKVSRQSWGGKVKGLVTDPSKNICLIQRAETLFHCLRLRFPALPQTALDMTKIQYNQDVGQSILESYSRVMESLAFNIIARIDDVLYVDDAIKRCVEAEVVISLFNRGGLNGHPIQKRLSPSPFSIRHTPYATPFATPTFCSSTPAMGTPGRASSFAKYRVKERADSDKYYWSHAGNLSDRRSSGMTPGI